MTATEPGLQRSTWQLANADGDRFGDEFFAEVVAEPASDDAMVTL